MLSSAFISRAQMKIGGVPGAANPSAYLQLGDSTGATKGFLMPRIALTATNTAAPLSAHVAGMLIYNTATAGTGIYSVSPGIYYNDGTRWVGMPYVSGSASSSVAGSYVSYSDSNTVFVTPYGMQYGLDGKLNLSDTAFMLAGYLHGAGNGLTKNGRIAELGGALNRPTIVHTSALNSLSFTGLQPGALSDSILVSEAGTGILKKIAPGTGGSSNVAKSRITASGGQTQFAAPQPVTDINKVNVYRNGVRVDVQQVSSSTIQLEAGVVCDANDEIRIIQYY